MGRTQKRSKTFKQEVRESAIRFGILYAVMNYDVSIKEVKKCLKMKSKI